jgi:hypothetical protein
MSSAKTSDEQKYTVPKAISFGSKKKVISFKGK